MYRNVVIEMSADRNGETEKSCSATKRVNIIHFSISKDYITLTSSVKERKSATDLILGFAKKKHIQSQFFQTVLHCNLYAACRSQAKTGNVCIGVAREGKVANPPTFLECRVILCFERRFSKQNSVIRLKSNILAHPNFFPPIFLGYLRH